MTHNRSDLALFPYNPRYRAAIGASLSGDRFGRYLAEAGNDEAKALSLYTWNTALAAAFYGPLQACEVTLRNAVHDTLSASYGATWYLTAPSLRGDELGKAQRAEDTVRTIGKGVTPGRVVAELGFGYWVGLFANVYDETLWRSDLFRMFKTKVRRRELFDKLDRLRTLRNRVAHHEPIYHRVLMDDYQRILDVVGSLSPEVCDWVQHHSRVYDVLAMDHAEVERF